MSARRIIVNADDLGLCASVNSAIFEAFRTGNLSSATLMANMPGLDDAVERLKDHPGLAVGLHFNITEGRALTGASSLTDAGGSFMPRGALIKAAYAGGVKGGDLRREFTAQWERLTSLGVRPGHADSHQHSMMPPPVFRALVPVLRELGAPVRIVRPPFATVRRDLARPTRAAKQALNLAFAAVDRARSPVPTNDRLVSVHDLASAGPYAAETYHHLIARCAPTEVVEVMVHPYILGEDVRALYQDSLDAKMPFLRRCGAEYAALTGPPIFGAYRMTTFAEALRP